MKLRNIVPILFMGLVVGACTPADSTKIDALTTNDAELTQVGSSSPEPLIMGQIYTITSSVLGADRRLTVRLPFYYDKEPERKFPVVYVIDGGPEQDFPHIAGIAQSRDINFTFEPFILVGVETVNRRYQITPPVSDPDFYEKELGTRPGGSEDFRKFLREDIMPWVEDKYRTNGQDAVIGESLGGLFIVETFLKDPTLFDDYIAVSPSLWWDEMTLGKGAALDLAAMPAGKRRLYLTMGDEAVLMQEGLDKLVAALEANTPEGLGWTYIERKDSESHASIYHVAALDAFRALYLVPARTGGSNPATFTNGIVPPLTAAVKENLEHACDREHATTISFKEKNKYPNTWRGMCLVMKPGAKATAGHLDY
ncbi:MAG: esterase [Robiginitomaculum sp.]|nr:MAG: esterase [Robiginitomaculum sp.]